MRGMTQAREETLTNPRLWRAVRRMTQRLSWQLWWLAMLGWLETSGPWARWASYRLSELEHGLRCLLVIALQGKASAMLANRKSQPEASSSEPTQVDEGPRTRLPGGRFALSAEDLVRRLGCAGDRPLQRPPFDPFRGERGTQAQSKNKTPALLARMRALAQALADPDPVMARLTKRLTAMGLRVLRITLRPANQAVWPEDCALGHLTVARTPAICDSS